MTLQTSVNIKQAAAKVGTFSDNSARRVKAYALTNGGSAAVLARFYTLDSNGKCVMGGASTNKPLGVAMNEGMVSIPTLSATITVDENTVDDVCSFGHIFVAAAAATAVGDKAYYVPATGVITNDPDMSDDQTPVPQNVEIKGAAFISAAAASGDVVELSLNGL